MRVDRDDVSLGVDALAGDMGVADTGAAVRVARRGVGGGGCGRQ